MLAAGGFKLLVPLLHLPLKGAPKEPHGMATKFGIRN